MSERSVAPRRRRPEGVSRRGFVHGALKAGTAAGAALWIAPRLSSVALAQTADVGSPPPPTSEVPVTVEGTPQVSEPVGGATVGGAASSANPVRTAVGGALAMTGMDPTALTLAGGAAVVAGRALMLARPASRPDADLSAPPGADAPT